MACNVDGKPCPIIFEILGSGTHAVKLRQRLGCALASLGFRAPVIPIRADNERILALGADRDPVLVADGNLLAQGLPRTEELQALLAQQPRLRDPAPQ